MVKRQTTTNFTCFDIANYFLSLVDEETGDSISNLKLQKLVYYAQGFSLVIHDRPLFKDTIEAWALGPVIPKLYRKYKEYAANSIPIPTKLDVSKFDENTTNLLNEVYAVFGQYSAWKLSQMTHREPPWVNAVGKPDNTITHESLKAYFETQLEDS